MRLFDTISAIEIIGYIITFGVSSYTFIRSFRGDPERKELLKLFASIYAILGIVVTICLSIRYQYIEEIELTRDENALNVVRDYQSLNKTIEESQIPFIKLLCQSRKDVFLKTIKDSSNQKYMVDVNELVKFAKHLFLNERNTTILATSYVKPSDWWKKDWGKEYLYENYDAISRGCSIERIYIFATQKEMQENLELLTEQKKNGVKIYYTFTTDIHDLHIKDDIIVVGDKITGTLNLKDREMVNAEFSTNTYDISLNKDKFQDLRKHSKPY